MKQRYIVFLTLALIALAGVYFLQQRPRETPEAELFTRLGPDVSLDSLAGIEVWSQRDAASAHLRLEKRDGDWMVERKDGESTFFAPAKKDRIERLVETLRDLRGEKRAAGPEVFETFSLTDGEALHIALRETGKELEPLLVGKRGPSWDSSFVRKASSQDVYLASKNLLSLFDLWDELPEKTPGPRPWTDSTVIAEGPQQLEGLSFSRGAEQWTLVMAESKEKADNATAAAGGEAAPTPPAEAQGKESWEYSADGNKQVKTGAEVQPVLSKIFPLRAQDVCDPGESRNYGLGPGEQHGRLTVHLKSKGLEILHLGRMDKNRQIGWIRNDKGHIYEVTAEAMDTLSAPFKANEKAGDADATRSEGPRQD
jgi:hypothetical protein